MPHLPNLPLDAPGYVFAVLMGIVLVAPVVAERLRVPGLVGLILAGMLVGPNVAGLVERQGVVAVLGSAGLLYLIFVAGLELDLDELGQHRRDGLTFGAATFAVPMLVGYPVMSAMGYAPLPALLLSSAWASHTLLAYPVFRRYGVATNRAVATSVGATILTDTAALLVLVVVARATGGGLDLVFWGGLVIGLAVLVATTAWLLPRVGHWFFARHGRDRNARLVFLLFALFASGSVAELVGIEAIIGAFLAGLSLNRMVPHNSRLMANVDVLGATLLIPLFLVSVGMLVDPTVLFAPEVLATSAGFTAVALGAKWLAAEAAGRLLRYSSAERQTMFSLSSAQAAATLAAVFVGLDVGLVDTRTVNAVVGVILVTCLVSSWVAGFAAPRLPAPARRRAIGQTVVVPVARPASAAPLAALAATMARRDGGLVLPVIVVPPGPEGGPLEDARRVSHEAEQVAAATGVEAHGIVRVDSDVIGGILHAAAEHDGTLLVLGWHGQRPDDHGSLGRLLEGMVARSGIATLVANVSSSSWSQVRMVVAPRDLEPSGIAGLRLALTVTQRLARGSGPPMVVAERDDDLLRSVVGEVLGQDVEMTFHGGRSWQALAEQASIDDLVVLTSEPDARRLRGPIERVARALPDHQFVVAVDHSTAVAPSAVAGDTDGGDAPDGTSRQPA